MRHRAPSLVRACGVSSVAGTLRSGQSFSSISRMRCSGIGRRRSKALWKANSSERYRSAQIDSIQSATGYQAGPKSAEPRRIRLAGFGAGNANLRMDAKISLAVLDTRDQWYPGLGGDEGQVVSFAFAPPPQLGRKGMKMSPTMRAVSIACCVALFALNAVSLFTAGSQYNLYFSGASLAIAFALLVVMLVTRDKGPEPERPRAEAAKPKPVPAATSQAEAEIVSFLATFQERGRLVDFLMEDITTYNDAEVGAAARVVHAGCNAVLQEHFRIRPLREEPEGSSVTVAVGYAADEYRLIGKIGGAGPFSGTLVHRGWKTESVKLPRIVQVDAGRLPTIAPAEIEMK
jgi:Domain of unknown function (DUF2760)